ncbi:MAG: ShlB/FhaC/HecB family hemolysin secretion/activation protein, partial [Rivularia sp. (in: cyanobacteria)]
QLAIDKPLNLNRLRTALRLLQQNPVIKEVEAELTPSNTSGRNILIVKLTEAPAFHTDFSVANNISPSIGSTQGTVFITHNNLLGNGDRLNAAYGITEGLDIYNVSYSVPLNSRDGTFSVSYGNNDSNIIEGDFQDLDISSESRTFSVRYSQPLLKTPTNEFVLSLGLDLRQSKTFLADEPFSFSLGPEDGESKVTVLRFSQDWFNRGNNQIFAARSQFSIGLDAFDATINDTGTDGQFFAWVGQFQWAQQLPSRIVLVARINTQLTPDSLLPLERLSIGGIETIRGYRENQIVTDNGILGSLEFRIPLTSDSNQLQLVPFFDIGTGWNNDDPDPNPSTIASLGTGLRWRIGSGLNLRLDYGIPLIEIDNRGDSLQENGFHFAVFYRPF